MNIIKRTREEHGYTKAQMARCLGICKSYYTMIENSDRQVSKRVGLLIHKKFGVPLEDLFLDQGFTLKELGPTTSKPSKGDK